MKIAVWLYRLNKENYPQLDAITPALHEADKRRAIAFHNAIDKYRFLAGRWLLLQWLKEKGIPGSTIGSIIHNEYKRPVLKDITFSISHAGHWVGLAIAGGQQHIGLDIEENKPIDVQAYMLPFTTAEQQYILKENTADRFYELWTRKEAVLKAIGKGFLLEPASVCVLNDNIIAEGIALYTCNLHIAHGYTSHIAADVPVSQSTINIVVKS